MKTIKIINSLHIDEKGVQAKTKNGRFQTVHLRQGDLDGACAVYSTMMILIMIGVVKYNDVKVGGNNYDKRYSIERLKKELMDTKGLHRNGNYFNNDNYDDLKKMLQRSYSQWVTVNHEEENIIDKIDENIEKNQPVLLSISYKVGGTHAIVVIGVEYDNDNNPTKILCLDPGYSRPKFTYWNSVIDLKHLVGKYPFRNITESGDTHYVKLNEILIISKKF
jgi:hypothetical protein